MRVPISLLCLLLLFMIGCGGAPQDAPSTADYEKARMLAAKKNSPKSGKQVAKKSAAPTKAKANVEDASSPGGFGDFDEGYVYDPTGKRDPFHSLVLEAIAMEQEDGERGPLELFDLSQLRLVAVVASQSNPRGLVYDPSGKGYIVGLGTAIGKKNGKIVEIGDETMVVQETYVDFSGTRTARNVELKIRQSEGG
jgi:type IV pilus assembly protein PilP